MPQKPNANQSLPSCPPPEPLNVCQPSEPKRNRRGKVNALRLENGRFKSQCSPTKEKTITKVPTAPTTTTSENSASLKMTFWVSPHDNLPPINYANSPFITASPVISSESHYVNVPTVIYSSSNNGCSYPINDTLVPTLSTFFFLHLSKLFVTLFLLSFKRRNTQHASVYNCLFLKTCNPNISNIRSFLTSIQCCTSIQLYNRNYITFDSIVRSCITQLIGINYAFAFCFSIIIIILHLVEIIFNKTLLINKFNYYIVIWICFVYYIQFVTWQRLIVMWMAVKEVGQ